MAEREAVRYANTIVMHGKLIKLQRAWRYHVLLVSAALPRPTRAPHTGCTSAGGRVHVTELALLRAYFAASHSTPVPPLRRALENDKA